MIKRDSNVEGIHGKEYEKFCDDWHQDRYNRYSDLHTRLHQSDYTITAEDKSMMQQALTFYLQKSF